MQDRRVAKRYAKALFSTVVKYDVIASVEDDLNGIVGLLENDPQFKDFILSPLVGRDEKLKIVEKLFSDRVTAMTMHLLRLLLSKRREMELIAIRDEFVALRRDHEGIMLVVFTSAEQLDDNQKQALIAKVEKETQKKIEPVFEIDAHLMGGVKVLFNNYVLDGTVRGSLNALKETLRYDLLKQH